MSKQKERIVFSGIIAAIFIAAIISVCIGKYEISLGEIRQILQGDPDVSEMSRQVLFTLRVPRTVMGILAGAGLGLAGCVYQIIFKNPLASPDIIGIAGGANLGAALAIVSVSSAACEGHRASVDSDLCSGRDRDQRCFKGRYHGAEIFCGSGK